LAILIAEHLRKVFPRWIVPPCIISGVHTDSATLSWVIRTIQAIIMASDGPERSKQGTAGKWKHLTLNNSTETFEIILMLPYGGSCIEVMAACNTGCDAEKWRDQL
jgi:hypothetical protein